MMNKRILGILFLVVITSSTVYAQERRVDPMLGSGVKEFAIRGDIDLKGTQGDVDATVDASYGYFMSEGTEIGPYINFSRSNDGTVMNYGLGAFGEYHLPDMHLVSFAATIPYIGASLGVAFLDTDIGEDQAAITFTPQIGIKWFFRDYVAMDTNFYFATATDDIYINDNEAEDYDFGFKIGLRVLFK